MKLTVAVQLKPTQKQHHALRVTLERANKAANVISDEAWANRVFGQFKLHKLCYQAVRDTFDLSAQVVVRVIAKVADAYKLDKKRKRTFKPHGSIAYDDRIVKWFSDSVSIWTVDGRERMPFVCGPAQRELLKYRQGESDLVYRSGKWFLFTTVNVEEPPITEPLDVLGVDLGITNIATDSQGNVYSGSHLTHLRQRNAKIRKRLQRKGTKSANRLLKKRSRKERRLATDVNHVISKQIVKTAERTKSAIALEELKGIRTRIRARKAERGSLHSWAFYQLRTFTEYKARRAGVAVVPVDPRNSSRECSECGHIAKANRPNQATFLCQCCSHASNADYNAALNLRNRGRVALSTDQTRAAQTTDLQSASFMGR